MSWHKHVSSDPTDAYVQNAREQKLLELHLQEIDKLWFGELRQLAKEKLEATDELVKFENSKKTLDYFDSSIRPKNLRKYTDEIIQRVRFGDKDKDRDNFDFSASTARERFHPLAVPPFLPKLDCTENEAKSMPILYSSRTSLNIKNSRLKSSSDSNLHMNSMYKDDHSHSKAKRVQDQTASSQKQRNGETLPPLTPGLPRASPSKMEPPHRHLKQRMNTHINLPPVKEVHTLKRKLSI